MRDISLIGNGWKTTSNLCLTVIELTTENQRNPFYIIRTPFKPSEPYYFSKKKLKTRKTALEIIQSGLLLLQKCRKALF